jgi:hypothetical protein
MGNLGRLGKNTNDFAGPQNLDETPTKNLDRYKHLYMDVYTQLFADANKDSSGKINESN